MPFNFQLEEAWIVSEDNKIEVKKVNTVDKTIRDTNTSANRNPLNASATTKLVKYSTIVYIPHYLLSVLLME